MGLGMRALLREGWLVPVGAVVAATRRALLWPAWAVLWTVLLRAAVRALQANPLDRDGPIEGALAALGSPRLLGLFAGLWLSGTLLGAALRVAWLSGALPTLGGAMAGAPGPRFAAGVAGGFPRVLAAAALAFAADVGAALFGWTLGLAALGVTVEVAGRGGGGLLAGAVALALTLAVAVPVALGALGDAAVARAALRAEGPGTAFAASARRFLARPGAFVLGALAFALAAAIGPASIETLAGAATGFARGVDPVVLLGPNLVVAVLGLLVAAALDLWRLGTFAALGCGEG
jgi:peptide/nickel transport system permease protein